MNVNTMNQVQQLLFEKTLLAFHQVIPGYKVREWQSGLSLTEMSDVADHFVAMFRAWFLNGHKTDVLTERNTIEFPASPWEFFKQRHAPKWLLRRWPVRMESRQFRVAIHHHYVCPHVVVPGDEGSHVHYAWMGEMSGQIPKDYPV